MVLFVILRACVSCYSATVIFYSDRWFESSKLRKSSLWTVEISTRAWEARDRTKCRSAAELWDHHRLWALCLSLLSCFSFTPPLTSFMLLFALLISRKQKQILIYRDKKKLYNKMIWTKLNNKSKPNIHLKTILFETKSKLI